MKEDLRKFSELLRTDTEFQNKLKAAVDSYTGEQTEEAIFNGVLVPLGKEYGISASFEEFSDYLKEISSEDGAMSADELKQIAGGGKGSGFGGSICLAVGVGLGAGHDDTSGVGCLVVGAGNSGSACSGDGVSTGDLF